MHTESESPTSGESADVRHVVRVQGWELAVMAGESEPELRVRDVDLGRRLRYANPIDIRKLVRRLMEDGKLKASEVLATVAKTSERGGRPGTEYWLSEAAALEVIAKSETALADEILDEMIRVYMLARRGLLPGRPAIPPEFIALVTQLAEGFRQVVETQRQQGEALLALARRIEAVESGAGTISRVQVASIRQQVDTIARGRARAGLAPSKKSACTWTYNRILSIAGWVGTGRRLANMPADRYATVLAELDALRREVSAAIEALASRQLTLVGTGEDESRH